MATEVQHGPNPRFNAQTSGSFGLTIEGHYTATPDLAAGGVTASHYKSDRPAKRRNELLAMRTIFLHWWLREWMGNEGTLGGGLDHLARPQRTAGL